MQLLEMVGEILSSGSGNRGLHHLDDHGRDIVDDCRYRTPGQSKGIGNRCLGFEISVHKRKDWQASSKLIVQVSLVIRSFDYLRLPFCNENVVSADLPSLLSFKTS